MKRRYWVKLTLCLLLLVALSVSCVTSSDNLEFASEYFNIGNAFMDLGELENAKKYYEKSLMFDPEFHKVRYNLVDACIGLSDFVMAKSHLEYLVKNDIDNNKLTKQLAYLYYSEGLVDESLQLYLEVYESGDVSLDVKKNILKLYFQLEDYELALKFVDEILIEISDPEIYFMGGLVSESLGDFDLAVLYFENSFQFGYEESMLFDHMLDTYSSVLNVETRKEILELVIVSGDDVHKSEAYFELARNSLLIDNDFSRGYDFLGNAVDLGYNNKDAILELLKEPNLIEIDKIRLLFVNNGIID